MGCLQMFTSPMPFLHKRAGWPSVRLLNELTSVLCWGITSPMHFQQNIHTLVLQGEMGSDNCAKWSLSFIFSLFKNSFWVKPHIVVLLTAGFCKERSYVIILGR